MRWNSVVAVAVCLVATCLLAVPTALAGNGHFIHGVGPVNSSMGGAGVALPQGAVASLYLNPALLTKIEGHAFEFDVELVQSKPTIASTVQTPFGAFSGKTEDETDLAVVPSSAWARGPRDGGNLAYGMGFLSLAGFGSDFPQDPGNPILAPQPQGFGAVYSSYRFLKVPVAAAWQLNDRLALGVSFNGGWASLSARPFGGAAPDCSSPTTCYFPDLQEDSSFGWGAQVGIHYEVTEAWALGLSYSTKMRFNEFDWNTTHANPNLPNFGTAREVQFTLDVPRSVTFGTGYQRGPFSFALDGRWINYEDTVGFGSGFDPRTGAALGLGWQDIWVWAVGAEYQVTPAVALRGGWNRSEAAVTSDSVFGNVASLALFEDHLTLGLGIQASEALELNFAYYRVFENEETGPFLGPQGPVPGTSVTGTMEVDSFLFGFSFGL